MEKQGYNEMAYMLLRVTMGLNIMFHGVVRLPKIAAFREWMVSEFAGTFLPSWSVYTFSSVLPVLEFVIGLLILLGLFTFLATSAGALLMACLVTGACLLEQWEWAGLQMIYALFYYFLIVNISNNSYSFDTLFIRK